jgi:hypothetical protein
MAAPVSGPPIRTSIVIVSPIARPAIDLNVPRGSAAVANTTQTRKKVRIASTISPASGWMPGFRTGVPRLPSFASSKIQRSSAAATIAPANCATQ